MIDQFRIDSDDLNQSNESPNKKQMDIMKKKTEMLSDEFEAEEKLKQKEREE